MKYLKIFEEFVPDLTKSQWVDSEHMSNGVPVQYRVTPDNIEQVGPNPRETKLEVFVFGSNLQGIHTKGAARFAIDRGLADEGQIQGISKNGKAYAIPTQSNRQSLPLSEVKRFVDEFLQYAKKNSNHKFLVTKLGTGIAGFKVEEIAPLFAEAENIGNIYLPKEFWNQIL
jgi:hypothetical protein